MYEHKPTYTKPKPTHKLPEINIPKLSIPKIEIPKIKVKQIEIPKLKVPSIRPPRFKKRVINAGVLRALRSPFVAIGNLLSRDNVKRNFVFLSIKVSNEAS